MANATIEAISPTPARMPPLSAAEPMGKPASRYAWRSTSSAAIRSG
jgi:hypothetical protein